MLKSDLKKASKGIRLQEELASYVSDPNFFSSLEVLPNPDFVLRKIGKTHTVYDSILSDAHVKGEVRSIRGGLRRFDFRLVAGDVDDQRSLAALALCQQWMEQQPNQHSDWRDLLWQMSGMAALMGYRVHELVWQAVDGHILPEVKDRPNRRFVFANDGSLRLKSKSNPLDGEEVEPYKFIVSQHMASCENPYGEALLSSCFWPYTFKNGGFKFFVKFCERHGLPWPIGKYPIGAQDDEQLALLKSLTAMVENGAAAIPGDSSVELLTAQGGSGTLSQESLINLCNKEISKALTSQALTTELQDVGARAASEVSRSKELNVNDSVRDIAAHGMNKILRWITTFNFGEDVAAPVFEFYKDEVAGKERAEIYQIMAGLSGDVSRSSMFKELGIAQAEDDDDRINQPVSAQSQTTHFSECPSCHHDFSESAFEPHLGIAVDAANAVIEGEWLDTIALMLRQHEQEGKTLKDFQDSLHKLVPELDDELLTDITRKALELAAGEGFVDE